MDDDRRGEKEIPYQPIYIYLAWMVGVDDFN
jgi:hypothetical protein